MKANTRTLLNESNQHNRSANCPSFQSYTMMGSVTTTTVKTTKERRCEAEVHRTAGEISLTLPDPDTAKAKAYFRRSLRLAVTGSGETKANPKQAHELLAPV